MKTTLAKLLLVITILGGWSGLSNADPCGSPDPVKVINEARYLDGSINNAVSMRLSIHIIVVDYATGLIVHEYDDKAQTDPTPNGYATWALPTEFVLPHGGEYVVWGWWVGQMVTNTQNKYANGGWHHALTCFNSDGVFLNTIDLNTSSWNGQTEPPLEPYQ